MLIIRRNVLQSCYWINVVPDRVQRRVLKNGNGLSFSKKWSKRSLGNPCFWDMILHPWVAWSQPFQTWGRYVPSDIGILLTTEVASYPRRGPLLHCCENLKTDIMSSLAKRLSHVSLLRLLSLILCVPSSCCASQALAIQSAHTQHPITVCPFIVTSVRHISVV